MVRRSVITRWKAVTIPGALAAGWPLASAAQGLGSAVDAAIRAPAGQNIQQAAAAHVVNLIMTLVFWFGVVGLVAVTGLGVYGLVEARGDEDRREQAGRRVRWGVIGLVALLIIGLLGRLIFYR